MAAAGASSVNDGPVLSVINKRLRALRKKYNRILRMEEMLSQGKTLNKEQEEALGSKASVMGSINELEKLKSPVSAALQKELKELEVERKFSFVEEIIKLLYFATVFSLPKKSDFWESRVERERCLACTNVNDGNAREVVSEMDLTLISMLGSLMISRPVNWTLSHQNALQMCVEHARLWLAKSDQPIGSNPYLTCMMTYSHFSVD